MKGIGGAGISATYKRNVLPKHIKNATKSNCYKLTLTPFQNSLTIPPNGMESKRNVLVVHKTTPSILWMVQMQRILHGDFGATRLGKGNLQIVNQLANVRGAKLY